LFIRKIDAVVAYDSIPPAAGVSSAQLLNSFLINPLELRPTFGLHCTAKGARRRIFGYEGLTSLLGKAGRQQHQCEQGDRYDFGPANYHNREL
jgi:hypothetical protein